MTPWVLRLLFANIGAYFVQLTMPALTDQLAFIPAFAFREPWTIVTYMFLHGGTSHILFNMLGLYFFGPRVEARIGSTRFVQLYFVSGIFGALLSMLFAWQSPIIGASGAILGVTFAYARFWPRDKIFVWGILPVEVRWLVVFYIVSSVYSGMNGSRGGVADFAHLGGLLGAFLFLAWADLSRGDRKFRAAVTSPKVPAEQLAGWNRVDVSRVHELNRDEVNRILDKINATGIGSLTPQEKLFLSNFVPMDDRKPMA
ncbi:rhomboid family intramembrane serine protease [bacterium]|nr:rhomboid family intramembrane serine protease [bacterium]